MNVLIAIITGVLVFIGIVGTLVPFLPGEPLVFLGAIIYGIGFGFDRIGLVIYIILGVLAAFSLLVNYIATSLGAKRLGASAFGIVGAIFGATAGFLIGNLIGLLIGPFIGAFIGELIRTGRVEKSAKAGFGAVLGFFAGSLTRFLISLVMTALIIYGIVA